MNIFISGGCKNGKSMYAQKLAKSMAENNGKPLYYVATMIPTDGEDKNRVERHLEDREGWGFITLEQGRQICNALSNDVDCHGAFLLDSVTALLSNEMFAADGRFDLDAGDRVCKELLEFARQTGNTVFVSDYIYSEAKLFDEYTETYRRALAGIDRQLAQVCDQVIEVTYGQRNVYKKER